RGEGGGTLAPQMLIPIRDENPTSRTAVVTLGLIALNVIAFLLWEPTFKSEPVQQMFFFCHAEIPWETTHQTSLARGGPQAVSAIQADLKVSRAQAAGFQGLLKRKCPDKSWWQSIFVAMFLHGGWLHIGGNMLFLWIFGNNVEDRVGRFVYVLLYFLGGIAATALQTAVAPNSVIPNLGASGAIAAVLGAYIVMFPRARVLTLVFFFFITIIELPAIFVLGAWFVLLLFSGVGSLGAEVNGGVAYFAHVGGFVLGVVAAYLFFPRQRGGRRPAIPRRPDLI